MTPMSERRTIGQILISVGRVSEDDVATALEYQRDNGGFFGEALVACGILNEGELDWGLASQADLPYVYPDADAVDPEAAALVSPEWALTRLALPVIQSGGTLQVIVDSPMNKAIEELIEMTGLEVELALASTDAIRDLIRRVYARGTAADEEQHPPVELADAMDEILDAAASRFGISVRGARSTAWWDDRGTIRRRPLSGDWRSALNSLMMPGPTRMTPDQARIQWEAELYRSGSITPIAVDYISDESGSEFLINTRAPAVLIGERFTSPPEGVVSEIRMLCRAGTARFIVVVDPPHLGHEILPHLPSILLDPSWRSIYVNARDQDASEEAFSLRMPDDPKIWASEIEALRSFHFDVVTVDLSGGDKTWAGSALDIASVAFLLWQSDDDVRPAMEAGIRWQLRIEKGADDRLTWSLESLSA
jgi:type IV pilus assembly protein PilB